MWRSPDSNSPARRARLASCAQFGHKREKRLRLADEKSHVGQKRESPHGNAFRVRWSNDRTNRKASIQERTRFGHDQSLVEELVPPPPNQGNFTETPVTGSTAVRGGALPATSDQVWKCMVSVGPMLIRIRSTSTSVALCASDG